MANDHPTLAAFMEFRSTMAEKTAKSVAPARRDGRGTGRRCANAVVALATAVSVASMSVMPASAQSIGFIRDAEIEDLLRDYTTPILKAAGVGASAVHIYLVGSTAFNAFVADGRRIFVNSGVLMQAKTPNEVIGVLAHETGHIAGGHLARMRQQLQNAQAISILATLLGAAAMGAGAASGDFGSGAQAGNALMLGGAQIAKRSLLSYQRSEEAAADRSAINYLNATGQSAKGMLTTFAGLADQSMLSAKYADPYAVSHPMPRERVSALERVARESPYFDRNDPPELQRRHDLVRAKLSGYLEHPGTVARRYPKSDKSLAANYARTVSQMRTGDYRAALASADGLIKAMPNNPYFWELKGDLLVKSGKPREAIAPYQKAVALAPNPGLIKVSLGGALVAANDPALLNEGIKYLNGGLQEEPDFVTGYRHLAIAYGRAGRVPEAELATAQEHFKRGDYEMAQRFAQRAKQGLKTGSPAWLRADDILTYKPPRS
ncbi:M48 family metalloprotease [Microbaculum marinisediminis]|uniref:M48 family metalloprotease n=1 Tax=Microbaculum marinisediminis TaxID=2931392 RepID=A0AAW5R1D9_9HYPH|nr:M48 family metalloprotease [Microbaculum sp. A6E488]MCT8973135.1 M48 family metalloprotease [Microbaculum sp. A6E488]